MQCYIHQVSETQSTMWPYKTSENRIPLCFSSSSQGVHCSSNQGVHIDGFSNQQNLAVILDYKLQF